MRINKFFLRRALGLSLTLTLVAGIPACGRASQRVVYVYDGDTLRLANGTKVRLIGIDCPEMRDNDKLRADARRSGQELSRIMAQGRQAYDFTRELILGREVWLEYDLEKTDKYGRTLAYVWFAIGPDGVYGKEGIPDDFVVKRRSDDPKRPGEWVFLNGTILKAGYARPMNIPPNTRFADDFRSFYQEARENQRGLWK